MGTFTPGPGPTSGADVFTGFDTAETADGQGGDDTLFGNGGDDTLTGGAGKDQVEGGEGNDTFLIDDGDLVAGETIIGGDGQDIISFVGSDDFDISSIVVSGVESFTAPVGLTAFMTADQFNGFTVSVAAHGGLALTTGGLVAPDGVDLSGVNRITLKASTTLDLSHALGAAIPNGIQGSDGNDVITLSDATSGSVNGASGDDSIAGGAGGDMIEGGGDLDTLHGGGGDDSLSVFSPDDIVANEIYDGGTGIDELSAMNPNPLRDASFDLSQVVIEDIENVSWGGLGGGSASLILTAAQLDAFSGSITADFGGKDLTLSTGGGVNLSGSALQFGTLNLNDAGNAVDLRGASGGIATLNGGAGNDIVYNNNSAATLNGGGGDDRLTGGAAADTLIGGGGNDIFVVGNSGASVTEDAAAAGSDTVFALVSYALQAGQSVELLATGALHGTMAITLKGNALAQAIIGNDGANLLSDGGAGGADTMSGFGGDDTYIVNNAADLVNESAARPGSDTVFAAVSYALQAGQSVDLLATASLAGTAAIKLSGNELAQAVIGNNGDNVLNDGGAGGADTMSGFTGNDTYVVNNAADIVNESPLRAGSDTVFTSVSYALQAGQSIDVLATASLHGTTAISLKGNTLAQTIFGNNGDNLLSDGGAGGADSMSGFTGNDTYIVNNAADIVNESPLRAGSDTVFASVSYALQAGQSVDLLATSSLHGTTIITLAGNELAQTIDGNFGANGLSGGGGNDTLFGFSGNDQISGGAGRDQLDGGFGSDTLLYAAVSESTGVGRDLVLNLNLNAADKFQFTVKPTAIDTAITHGALNTAGFDANLASAIGAGQLAAHHAVLFDPDSGDLNAAGHLFLVVDANNVAGYQAGQDYVVEFLNAASTLTLDDFV